MSEQDDPGPRCRAVILMLNLRERWGLTDEQINLYVEQITDQVPAAILATSLEIVSSQFHADHKLVAALRNEQDPDHERAWEKVASDITRIIRFNNLGKSPDRAVEFTDIVQVAQVELARALGNYHYKSSLRTWLQSVTIQRLRRYHRDNSAAKRSAQLEPLEEAAELQVEGESIEPQIMANELEAEIQRKLSAQHGERAARIFRMRVIDDLSAQEIGERVNLHPSRVRTILRLAFELLKNDVDLRNWNSEEDADD
jgi:RNA polymerase sigma factor (sigma-70 family)